jgi:transcriptional regulator with XRE-family HTH domain
MNRAADDGNQTNAKRRRLAAELRGLREMAGLSGRELAHQIGVSQSKVSRIEGGRTVPSIQEVTDWAKAAEVSDERREWLVAMTKAVFTDVQPWRASFSTNSHIQAEVQERERRARLIRTYQPSVVPGLLQTADYARRAYTLALPDPDYEIAAAIAGRMERQVALYEQDRRFEFVITEAALRWRPGSFDSQRAQLDRITAISTLDNVSIGVIPQASQATAPAPHVFIVYAENDGDLDDFVEVETVHANLIVNDLDDVAVYQQKWFMLCRSAIFADDMRKFLAELSVELKKSAG